MHHNITKTDVNSVFKKDNLIRISSFTFTIYLIHFLVFPFSRFLILNYRTQFITPVIHMLICVLLITIGKYMSKGLRLSVIYSINRN